MSDDLRGRLQPVVRGLLTQRVEESLSLRLIVLAMSWSTAVSLEWVGSPPWIWAGGAVLLSLGHAFSWFFRDLRSPMRSGAVAVLLLGALALLPRSVGPALAGDWLPFAQVLLLFQAVTSFELRTRGGLYAGIGVSGVILFFVSQQALDLMFGVFLTSYTTLLLSFFAMAFLLDQVRGAEVRWFRSRLSFAWFWSGIFVASMVMSVGVFLVLPKGFGNPLHGAQAAALPVRATESGEHRNPAPDLGLLEPEPTMTPADQARDPQPLAKQGGRDVKPPEDAPDSVPDLNTDEIGADSREDSAESSLAGAVARGEEPTPPPASEEGGAVQDTVVMYVRSPVLTYWRGQVFDTFDGETWYPDHRPRGLDPMTREGALERDSGRFDTRPLYTQTYFLEHPLPPGPLLAGYEPLGSTVATRDENKAPTGGTAIYRTVSALPDFSPQSLARSASRANTDSRYLEISPSLEALRPAAEAITGGASTELERMRRIVTYLNVEYGFDVEAVDQLSLGASPVDFLAVRSTGTSMDFGTATVLLARAAGIPSRLATGYLPGSFEPLTGAYEVRSSDRHAWAEAFLGDSGWVPFDGTPSEAVAAFRQGGTYRRVSTRALFGRAYGDEVFESIRSSPQWMSRLLKRGLEGDSLRLAGLALGAILLVAGTYFAWRLTPKPARRSRPTPYSRLAGETRSQLLRTYLASEKLLRGAGLPPRRPAQSFAEYGGVAEPRLGRVSVHLVWLRGVASAAAYDPSPSDPSLVHEAAEQPPPAEDCPKTCRTTAGELVRGQIGVSPGACAQSRWQGRHQVFHRVVASNYDDYTLYERAQRRLTRESVPLIRSEDVPFHFHNGHQKRHSAHIRKAGPFLRRMVCAGRIEGDHESPRAGKRSGWRAGPGGCGRYGSSLQEDRQAKPRRVELWPGSLSPNARQGQREDETRAVELVSSGGGRLSSSF